MDLSAPTHDSPAGHAAPDPDAWQHRFQSLCASAEREARPLTLAALCDAGLDRLPAPGGGRTLGRWRALAAVAAHDLSLAKLFEGHADALAILAECGASALAAPGSRWGTWCAEPPQARVLFDEESAGGTLLVRGTKAWCSGAHALSHALVSGWDVQGRPRLAALALAQPPVRITGEGWHAVGMAATGSVDVRLDGALADPVGGPRAYLDRPGFWQGGAGIAACWHGAACAIGEAVRAAAAQRDDELLRMHLGRIDTALAAAAHALRAAASWIDRHPRADAQALALRTRLVVEQAADTVIHLAGHALGAGPLCRDPVFARRMADLPVFLRQSHAERDLAQLGRLQAAPPNHTAEIHPWAL